MDRKDKFRFDYRIYHRIGKKTAKGKEPIKLKKESKMDEESKMNEEKQKSTKTIEIDPAHIKNVIQSEEEFFEEIEEFLMENVPSDAVNIEEIDEYISEIKELRRVFKRVHREMRTDIPEYNNVFALRLDSHINKMAEFIIEAKNEKKSRIDNEIKQKFWVEENAKRIVNEKAEAKYKLKVEQETRIIAIKNSEVQEKIAQIEKQCEIKEDDKNKNDEDKRKGVQSIQDEELLNLKSNLSNIDKDLKDLRNMRDRFENIVSGFEKREEIIEQLSKEISKISNIVSNYKEKLKIEVERRELEDYKLKSMDKLNIQLPKFSGTDNKVDIYSFQTKFEEEHARLPKRKCLYQLKEKYLVGAAKEMVKWEEDLDKVWVTLKDAFGDTVVLLNNEFDGVKKLGPLSKIKDHQELSLSLSKLSNAMENLSKLAKKHNIEYELYNSHSESILYEIIGEKRIEKFLEEIDDKDPKSKEEEWKLLKDFLRDEAKRRSKMAVRLKPISKTIPSKKEPASKDKLFYGREQDSDEDETEQDEDQSTTYQGKSLYNQCKVCGGFNCENKGDKGFEYVKCQEFRSMTPRDRMNKLRQDKVCFQCMQANYYYYYFFIYT